MTGIELAPKWWTGMEGPPGFPTIAFDPGLRTGIALLREDGSLSAGEAQFLEAIDIIEHAMRDFAPSRPHVVGEAFIITKATAEKTQAPWSLEGIGAVRWLCHRNALVMTTQRPVEAKRFATNERLAGRGWLIPTKGGHVNDAMRHLLVWLTKQNAVTHT